MDDDSSVLLKFEGGAKGVLLASQVLSGEINSLSIKVWGETGGIEWCQNDCNTLYVKSLDEPEKIYKSGTNISYLTQAALSHSRIPSGHPEGYFEAFANLYRNFAYSVLERVEGRKVDKEIYDFPGIEDGIRGMLFVEKVLESGKSDKKWISY